MTQRTLPKLAVSAFALALAMVSCKPGAGGHISSAGSTAPATGKLAEGLASEGARALAAGYAEPAIALTEQAVALAPRNADLRAQLGRAYMIGGRFRSAVAGFADARALGRDDGQLLLNLALAEMAAGDAAAAHETITAAAGRTGDADRGLALALAGDAADAVPLLEAAARAQGADATVRQNLALAYALAGRWGEARTTAAQDVSPALLDARLAQWATLASASTPGARISGLFSIPSTGDDPGLPATLALAGDRHAPAEAAVAQVSVAPPAQAPAEAVVQEAPAVAQPAPEAATDAVAPAAPVAVAEVPPSATVAVAAGAEAPVVVPAQSTDFVTPKPATPPPAPLLRAIARPAKVRLAAGELLRARPVSTGKGPWVVQLGAFSSPHRVETAWSRTQARVGLIASYTPARATVARGSLALHRLSLTGFATRARAVELCLRVRHAGGDCFVRPAAGDAPVQWVARNTKVQLASR